VLLTGLSFFLTFRIIKDKNFQKLWDISRKGSAMIEQRVGFFSFFGFFAEVCPPSS
jgi:hypothetical protein